ncbi:MAG: hypothetical protein V4702_01820 [Patescibacteria group bacterium]
MTKSSHSQLELIQPAVPADTDAILAILDRANQLALENSGEPMWTAMTYVHDQLRSQIESGDCFVMKDEQDTITSLIVITQQDTLWEDDGTDEQALYFHKLMKDPEIAPKGSGFPLIAFAAREAIRRGRTYLRCDTKTSMIQLIEYYRRLGFATKRSMTYPTTDQAGVLLEAKPEEVLQRIAKLF